ncbi:hypothetical protein AB1N83_013688 [Pleurotus pulmonarius]
MEQIQMAAFHSQRLLVCLLAHRTHLLFAYMVQHLDQRRCCSCWERPRTRHLHHRCLARHCHILDRMGRHSP